MDVTEGRTDERWRFYIPSQLRWRRDNKLTKSSPIYNKLQHYLIKHACMYVNISTINMYKLNKNREQRKK